MTKLDNPRHESFCKAYEELEASGVSGVVERGQRAYELAGNAPNRANHNKVLRRPEIQARLAELRDERRDRARAARWPIEDVLTMLESRGVVRVADFFELGTGGILRPRDLKTVPVEVAIAWLAFSREALGIIA